jgi:hypothetical protein
MVWKEEKIDFSIAIFPEFIAEPAWIIERENEKSE